MTDPDSADDANYEKILWSSISRNGTILVEGACFGKREVTSMVVK